MEENRKTIAKNCPMFVDFVRECLQIIETMPSEMLTFSYCLTEQHKHCPLFQYVRNRDEFCSYFQDCTFCSYHKHTDFSYLARMTEKWCHHNFDKCARHQLRRAGVTPDENLLPDGTVQAA